MTEPPLDVLLTMPAYWPAYAFGGPVVAARELTGRMVERGHTVEVVTTTLTSVGHSSRRTRVASVDGARVTYLGTAVGYRWMGITPTLPGYLRRLGRPDVVHVSGYRDQVSTVVAGWCRRKGIPYVFEPLGMLEPRVRKVRFKRVFDATIARGVVEDAAVVLVVSDREAEAVAARGIPDERIVVRGLGFPDPAAMPATTGELRRAIGVDATTPLILSVGRIAAGKGIEHLVEAARRIPAAHVALIGPDDRHGTRDALSAALAEPGLRDRLHLLPPTEGPPLSLYGDADVFVLASEGDSFGLVAAEAAAAGTAVVVTDRCGVAGEFHEGEAFVVPARAEAVIDALAQVLADEPLRRRLEKGALAAARRNTWEHAADIQEAAYRRAAATTVETNASRLGS